jgi:hypothetical protein
MGSALELNRFNCSPRSRSFVDQSSVRLNILPTAVSSSHINPNEIANLFSVDQSPVHYFETWVPFPRRAYARLAGDDRLVEYSPPACYPRAP